MAFNFLNLPAEIRYMIYSLLLLRSKPIQLYPPDCSWVFESEKTRKPNFRQSLMLLRVCRQINDEAGTVLYECNLFTICPDGQAWGGIETAAWLYRFVTDIGPTNRRKRLNIELHLDTPDFSTSEWVDPGHKCLTTSLETLWTYFTLNTLTVKLRVPSSWPRWLYDQFVFRYSFEVANSPTTDVQCADEASYPLPNGDWRRLEQLKLEFSASYQAILINQETKYAGANFAFDPMFPPNR